MLFQILFLALAGTSLATPVAGSLPPFSITLEAPQSVESVEDLWVVATLTNNGPQNVEIDPYDTVFGSSPTDDFIVDGSEADGQEKMAKFVGVFAKHVTNMSKLRKLGVLITVPAGQSISTNVSLASRYDLTASGAGNYTITTKDNIRHFLEGANGEKSATADVQTARVAITGGLARDKARSRQVKREVTFNGCSADQQTQIKRAAVNAQAGSQAAAGAVNGQDPAYTEWFGVDDGTRSGTVKQHYIAMNGRFDNIKYDCVDCAGDAGTFAQVLPDDISTIYLCGYFWKAGACGFDSQQGTLIHEASHFTAIAGTNDHVYSQDKCKELAKSDPATAIDNADSHEYYEETVFTGCSESA